jgi:hypothetical protein
MQPSTLQHLADYLETVSGTRPQLEALDVPQLPLFLRERFSFQRMDLFGRPWCIALQDRTWDTGTPGEYEKLLQTLRPLLKVPAVFVFSTLPSNTRNRLIHKGVPFIVPGTQAFLPAALVDLRERFPGLRGKGNKLLSPTAQLTLLYHLERESLSGLPLKHIAGKLDCSAMMLSKVKDELEEARICEVKRIGRSLVLTFPTSRQALWHSARERLASPVKKTRWVRCANGPLPGLEAGITALSRRTLIADNRIPTFALGRKTFESRLEQGVLTGCPDADEASAKIEVWSYPPELLGDKKTVDPLSLYLSLHAHSDVRVQQQLERLIGEVAW